MNNSSNYVPTQVELDRIRNIKDEDIDLSDAPETDAKFWESAKIVQAKARNKTIVSMRYDQDLLEWLKNEANKKGIGYQILIHSLIESYRDHNRHQI